jgi:predicted transcriptional regulator
MNNTERIENGLFKKTAEMMWILHRYHRENHNHFEKAKGHHEKNAKNRILAILKLQEEMDKKELMFILGIPEYHFDKILDKLEKEEYILSAKENDNITVKITEKGKSAEKQEEKSEFESIFDCLTEEEKTNFGQYIDTIISSVKPKLKDDSEDFENFHKGHFHRGDFHRGHFEQHGMDRGPGRCGMNRDPHEHFRFFEKPDMRNERNDRCEDRHRPYGHFDSDRNRDFREFFENFHRFHGSEQRRRECSERENEREYPGKFDFFDHRRR